MRLRTILTIIGLGLFLFTLTIASAFASQSKKAVLPENLVEVEVQVISIQLDDEHQTGIHWPTALKEFKTSPYYSSILIYDIRRLMEQLSQAGEPELLYNERMSTKCDTSANIRTVESIPFKEVRMKDGAPVENVSMRETGITLKFNIGINKDDEEWLVLDYALNMSLPTKTGLVDMEHRASTVVQDHNSVIIDKVFKPQEPIVVTAAKTDSGEGEAKEKKGSGGHNPVQVITLITPHIIGGPDF